VDDVASEHTLKCDPTNDASAPYANHGDWQPVSARQAVRRTPVDTEQDRHFGNGDRLSFD
jgi:hypothetical protein